MMPKMEEVPLDMQRDTRDTTLVTVTDTSVNIAHWLFRRTIRSIGSHMKEKLSSKIVMQKSSQILIESRRRKEEINGMMRVDTAKYDI